MINGVLQPTERILNIDQDIDTYSVAEEKVINMSDEEKQVFCKENQVPLDDGRIGEFLANYYEDLNGTDHQTLTTKWMYQQRQISH